MAEETNLNTQAIDAVRATLSVHQEAESKLGDIIARKNLLGQPIDRENRLRASASRQISHYNRRLAELEAAAVVTSAPTVEEVQEVQGFIAAVKNLAVADAMVDAGFAVIREAMSRSSEVASKAG